MNEVKAIGNFQMENEIIFRKSAYLQWGTSDESIGSFLLLNPGNAKLKTSLIEGKIKQEEVSLDPTMKQMVKLIERIYNKSELNGRASIYNLFALRNAKSEDAIKKFEALVKTEKVDPFEGIPNFSELKKHPWICCGWGINSDSNCKPLEQVKTSWNTIIEKSCIPRFGKRHNNGVDYYHLRPQIVSEQEELLKELLEIYQSKVNTHIG